MLAVIEHLYLNVTPRSALFKVVPSCYQEIVLDEWPMWLNFLRKPGL